MIHKFRAPLAALALAGCNGATIGSGDLADGVTTAYVLSSPAYTEMNPTIPDDPLTGVAVLMVEKLVFKAVLIEAGVEPDTANRIGDAHGWLWACHNLAFFAGATHALGLTVGAVCAALYWEDTAMACQGIPKPLMDYVGCDIPVGRRVA